MKNFYKVIALCAVLVLVPLVSFADSNFPISLKMGMRGEPTSFLQDFLADRGTYTGKIDGKFGFGTLKALKAWQSSVGLTPDGYFGLASRTKANEILADLLSASNATETAETGSIAPLSTIEGCTSTVGYSVSTGQKCDGTVLVPSAVSDTGTQTQISVLTNQVQNLNNTLKTIANNTTPVYNGSVNTVTISNVISGISPNAYANGGITKVISWSTNIPTSGKVFFWNSSDTQKKVKIDDVSGLSTNHQVNLEFPTYIGSDVIYYYQIESIASDGISVADYSGNYQAPKSPDQSPATPSISDTNYPKIIALKTKYSQDKALALGYANFSMFNVMTNEQLLNQVTSPDLAGSAEANQTLVNLIIDMRDIESQLELYSH